MGRVDGLDGVEGELNPPALLRVDSRSSLRPNSRYAVHDDVKSREVPVTFLPQVRPGERTRFLYASLAFMCVAAGGLVARTVGDTLFLTRFGSERLPLMYVSTALLVALISFAYSSGFGRWSFATMVGGVAALLAVAAVAVRMFLMGGSGASRVVAYLFAEVVIRLPLLLFWTVAALIFNAREAKRLVGPVGAAGTAACIVAGAAIPRVVEQFGTENLLWVQAALSAAFGFLAVAAARQAPPRANARPSDSPHSRLTYYLSLMSQRQVRALAALVALATISLLLTDFVFKSAARAEFEGPRLAAFFGRFYALANGGALLLQLLVVHQILVRGVGFALRILPAALLVGSAGMAVFHTFGWAVAAKFMEPLLDFTVNAAAVQLLYLAIQRQSRGQTRALVDGIVKPVAFASAGAVLVMTAHVVAPRYVAASVALLTLVWFWLARQNAKVYMAGLLHSIGMRRFDLAHERIEFSDSAVAEHVRQALRTSLDDDIPYLLALLPQWKGVDWTPEYRLLIGRPLAEVKTLCLEHLADHGAAADLDLVRRELEHEDPVVRRAAIRAATRLGGGTVAEWLVAILRDDRDATVRAAAAAELINAGDLEDLILAATSFRSMFASPQHIERIAAARSLILVERHTLTSVLLQLLRDADPDVRLVALEAAASQRAPVLLPAVVELLRDPRVGWKAAQVLPAFGAAAIDAVDAVVHDGMLDPAPRFALHVPPMFEQIGRSALPRLVQLLDAPDLDMRHAATVAYCNVIRRHGSAGELPRVEQLVWRELEASRAAASVAEDIAALPGNELLLLALQDECAQRVDALLRLLQVVQPDVDPALLGESLLEGGERRAEALEVLDNVLPSKFRRRVLATFESLPRAAAPHSALAELLAGGWSEWVTIGAIYCAGTGRRSDLRQAIEPYLGHRSAAVRETAEDALLRLGATALPIPSTQEDDVTLVKRSTV